MLLLKWYLSSWHYKTHGCKKPYNPIIGETFSCIVDTPESRVSYVAEQCNHHPPISAFYLENQKKQYCVNGYIWTKSHFTGNSAMGSMLGNIEVFQNSMKWYELVILSESSIIPSFQPLQEQVCFLVLFVCNWLTSWVSAVQRQVTVLRLNSMAKWVWGVWVIDSLCLEVITIEWLLRSLTMERWFIIFMAIGIPVSIWQIHRRSRNLSSSMSPSSLYSQRRS